MLLRKIMILSLCGICLASAARAGTIKGRIKDSRTGEPMAGATVLLEHTRYNTVVNLDGSFVLRHIPAGKYEVIASNIGYQKSKEYEVTLADDNSMQDISISLTSSSSLLDEVQVVTSTNGESDKGARRLEQKADMVENILSARSIQLSPDVTVANSLQRMSGVTIQRDNSGEGRYAIIRGMAQRYNNTLVNGIKIPSPDDKFRFVPMDIFPSEMLERLEVIKALTPNMEGDAIGGTMNLIMKNAPDNFLLTANVSAGYSAIFSDRPFSAFTHSGINKKSPAEIHGNNYPASAADFPLDNLHYHNLSSPINGTAGLTIGDRFLNKKLGVIISASYQNFYKGSNSENLIAGSLPTPGNTPSLEHAFDRQYSTQTNRVGIHNKIDYIFNSRNKISLYNLYLHQNDLETRYTPDTTIGTNSSVNSKSVDVTHRSRWQIQSIYNATLRGDHQLSDKLKMDWSGVYSIATKNTPDMASYDFNVNVLSDNSGKITQADSSTYQLNMSRIWQHNKDQDLTGYLNLSYTPTLFHREVEFAGGGLYRYKTRDSYYNDYSLVPLNAAGAPDTAKRFQAIDAVKLGFNPASSGTGNITTVKHANSYTAHEKIAAGYLQAKFLIVPSLQVLAGVRVENTVQDYTAAMPVTFDQRQGTIQYTDVLPSIHFKYRLDHKQSLRLSYFKSISRPGFGEIDPYEVPGDYWDEIGNPYIKHTRADNLDLRYELFPGLADQILLGAFYKQLQNPIEYFIFQNGHPSDLFIQPQNVGKATNYGLEAVITKYFGKFGVSANYTYTHSRVTTNKLFYTQQSINIITTQTRPMQGQADHVGNLSLLFKDARIGLDLQLAFSYTGDRIAQVSPYYNLDYWQKPYSQLDFSGEKRLAKRIYFYAKVNNITNSPNRLYLKFAPSAVNKANGGPALPYQTSNSYTTVQKDLYKIGFLGGFRYKF